MIINIIIFIPCDSSILLLRPIDEFNAGELIHPIWSKTKKSEKRSVQIHKKIIFMKKETTIHISMDVVYVFGFMNATIKADWLRINQTTNQNNKHICEWVSVYARERPHTHFEIPFELREKKTFFFSSVMPILFILPVRRWRIECVSVV